MNMSYEYDINKEKREAIEAGERALNSLRCAQRELDSARNWGFFDMFGGRGISTFVKHSKMNNAQQYMERAKYDLQAFSRELRDVSGYMNLDFNTGDFLSFADYFFDNFLVDLMVQNRINNAKRQIDEAIWRVEDIIRSLRMA